MTDTYKRSWNGFADYCFWGIDFYSGRSAWLPPSVPSLIGGLMTGYFLAVFGVLATGFAVLSGFGVAFAILGIAALVYWRKDIANWFSRLVTSPSSAPDQTQPNETPSPSNAAIRPHSANVSPHHQDTVLSERVMNAKEALSPLVDFEQNTMFSLTVIANRQPSNHNEGAHNTFVNQISNAMLAFSQALKQCTVADIDGLTSLEEHLTLAAPTDASSKTHKHLTLTDLTARKTLLIAERESTASFPPTTAASGPLFAPAQAGAAPVKPYWPPENSSPAIKRLHDLLAPFTTFKTTRSEVACPFDLARFKEEEAASFLENYVQALNACSVSDFRAIEDLSSSIEASFNRSNKPEQLLALVHGTNARSLVLSYEYYNKPLPANMEHYKTDLMRAATEDTVHAYLFTSSATP